MTPSAGSSRESAKQRALRIPLDYYRRTTGLGRTKWCLTIAAFILAAAYSIWTAAGWMAGQGAAARPFSPGPVTSAHAAWNDQCVACHTKGVPLRSDSDGIALLHRLVSRDEPEARTVNDARCGVCHVGHAHHDRQRDVDVPACAACHRDHQGTAHDLRRVADSACVVCHRDIAHHGNLEPASAAPTNVTSWADHPPFRSLPVEDPGRIKFNHRLHLLPGQFPRNAKATGPKRLSSIDPAYWPTLGYAADAPPDTIVELDCAACHEADPAARTRSTRGANTLVGAVPSAGDYFQPITYDRHCAACHDADLHLTIAVAGGSANGAIPHGLRTGALRQQVAGIAIGSQAFDTPTRLVPPRPIPGRTSGANLAQTTGVELAVRLRQAEQELRGEQRCGKCHHYAGPPPDAPTSADLLPDVLPASIPAVWLPKARFDHAAHRAVTCFECHDRAALEWAVADKPPLDAAKPLIPTIDNCRRCHGANSEHPGTGARTDCAECHRYHAADRRPTGVGAHSVALPPDKRLNGRQLLQPAERP